MPVEDSVVMAEQQNPPSSDVEGPQLQTTVIDQPVNVHQSRLPTTAITPPPPVQTATSVPNCLMYKNWLQQFTCRMSLGFPVYQTVSKGANHEPKFRSTVIVDGTSYTSPHTFSQRKNAEQDAARIALECVAQKLKDESYLAIREDNTFCKSILNEYAVKMRLIMPSYQTKTESGLLPVFVSSVDFNGVSYTGNKGRNKREAEQLAARVVILSILDSGDESLNVMVGIIRSKFKLLYAATNKSNESTSICSVAVSSLNSQEDLVTLLNKRKEAEMNPSVVTLSGACTSESASDVLVKMQPAHLPIHHFKKSKGENVPAVVVPSIEFVPAGSELAVVPSISSSKKNRKNKKKGKRRLQICPEMPVGTLPTTDITPSVTL